MVKVKKLGAVVALEKEQQHAVSQEAVKIKQKLKTGEIKIKGKKKRKIEFGQNRGLVYLGHLPHGFYETQIKDFFSQFGAVTNVLVCRSARTGNSKGYGFVEFKLPAVAKIAAETMNNYLMFNRKLISEYVPFETRPKYLFDGKKNTEKKYSILKRRLANIRRKDKVLTHSQQEGKSKRILTNLQKKLQKLRERGFNLDVKPVDVPEVHEDTPAKKKLAKGNASAKTIKSPSPLKKKVKKEENNELLGKKKVKIEQLSPKKKTTKISERKSTPLKSKTKKEKTISSGGITKKKTKTTNKQLAFNKDTIKKAFKDLAISNLVTLSKSKKKVK